MKNTSNFLTLSALTFFICSTASAANYIACENQGGFETNCGVTEFSLSSLAPVEKEIQIGYRFACIGDEVTIGVQESSRNVFSAFKQSVEWATLTLTGYGPIKVYDPDHSWTKSAYFQTGCSLDVKVLSSDLSTVEKKRLDDLLKAVSGQSKVVNDLAPLLTNVALFKTILNQLDIPSIVSIMREKYNYVKTLKDAYDAGLNTTASDALSIVLEDLKVAICLNPSMAEKNSDICTDPVAVPPAKDNEAKQKQDLVSKATTALSDIETAVSNVKTSSASAVSDPLVSVSELLGYSSEGTKQATIEKLCPMLKNLEIKNPNCK